MAAGLNGTLEFTSRNWGTYNGSRIRIDWSETFDTAANTSTVTFSNARLTLRNASGTTWISMRLRADGTDVINADTYRGDFGGWLAADTETALTPQGTWPKSVTVTHSADGTGSVTVSASGMRVLNESYGRSDSFDDTAVTLTLTAIPRASDFAVSGTAIGSAMNISVYRAAPAFTHKLYYRFGADAYTLMAQGVGTSYSWTIPESLGGKIPSATSGTWQIKCETYNGAALVGETVKTVTLTIPNYSLTGSGWYSASYTNTGTAASGIGKPVKGYSKLVYSADKSRVSTRFGATLGAPTVTVNGSAIPSGQTMTAVSNAVVFKITDSRGKSLTASVTVTAFDYANPALAGVSAARCDASGTPDDEGAFWYAKATASISSIDGANTYTLSAAIRPAGGSYGAENTLTSGVKSVFGGSLSATASYTVRIRLTDALGNAAQVEVQIPTMEVTFNAKAGGRAFAFGKTANSTPDDTLDVAWNVNVDRDLAFKNITRRDIESGTDLRTILDGGHYRCRQTATVATLVDCPTNRAFVMDVYSTTGEATGSGTYKYLAYEITDNTGRQFRRSARSESTQVFVFSDWEEVAGITSSGNYLRLSDGTQICWGRFAPGNITAGTTYLETTVPFPAPFSAGGSAVNIIATYCNNTSNVNNVALCDARSTQTTATEWHPRIFRQAGAPTTSAITPAFFYIAIGRWK